VKLKKNTGPHGNQRDVCNCCDINVASVKVHMQIVSGFNNFLRQLNSFRQCHSCICTIVVRYCTFYQEHWSLKHRDYLLQWVVKTFTYLQVTHIFRKFIGQVSIRAMTLVNECLNISWRKFFIFDLLTVKTDVMVFAIHTIDYDVNLYKKVTRKFLHH
jgi:hypothetical protein